MKRNPNVPQSRTDYHRNYARRTRQIVKTAQRKELEQSIPLLRKTIGEDKIAYIAGLLDGEGSISITLHRDKRLLHRRTINTITMSPYVTITNTNFDCLRFVQQTLNFGKIRCQSNPTVNLKPVWFYWVRKRKHLIMLLCLVMPYLIVKREVAYHTLQFTLSREFTVHKRPPFASRWYNEYEIKLVKKVRDLQLRTYGKK